MAWYGSRREAILAGEKLTPQNREEAILMGLIEPATEKEVALLESVKKTQKDIPVVETVPEEEVVEEAPKPKRKPKKKEE